MKPFYSVSSRGDAVLNEHAKYLLFKIHCEHGALAYDANGRTRPLAECDINDVRLIADQWRIQSKFEHPIQRVRDTEFVLGERLNRTEKNKFEFYRARPVGHNAYGKFLISGLEKVVAKYETDNKTYWAYGGTIAEARAFLGIALYDEYQNLIHSVACKNKNNEK